MAAGEDRWDRYDASQDWRADGPFDLDEVDLDADQVQRIDLGCLIITPEPDMQIQIVADAETNQGIALVVELTGSAMQVEVRAAPASGGYAKQMRDDIAQETIDADGTVERDEGPFGTELRRVLKAQDAEGNEGYMALRDWFAEGPRWILNGRLMGEAALDVAQEQAAVPFWDFFSNIVVRRGSEPMAPGHLIPIELPKSA